MSCSPLVHQSWLTHPSLDHIGSSRLFSLWYVHTAFLLYDRSLLCHVHCTVTPALNILGISLDIFSLWYAHSFPFVWWPFVRKVLLVFCTLVSAILRISLDIFTLVCAWWPFVRSVVTSGRWLCHCRCHESELTDSPLLTILTGYLWIWSLWIWSLRYARTAFFCVVGHSLVMYQGWLTHPCLDRSYTRRTGGILTKVRHGCFGNLGLFSSTFLWLFWHRIPN